MARGVTSGINTPDLPGMVSRAKPGTRPNIRRVYHILGTGPALQYIVHNNSFHNVRRGIAERVLYIKTIDGEYEPTVKPVAKVFQERMLEFRSKIRKHLPSTTPIPRDQFPLLYKGRRQTVYALAVISLSLKAVERRDSFLKAFVKAEKILWAVAAAVSCVTAKVDPAPRLIQPRDPRYNVEVGRYLKPYEGLVYKAIGKVWGDVTVAKGLNATQRGTLIEAKWNHFRNPIAVGIDASRFDQHVSATALEWEHSVYHLMNDSAEFKRLLSWQVHNRGSAYTREGKVTYKVNGCRMSGDMNTALGNCLLMSAMVWSYSQSCGIDSKLINDGDDCVVFMERRMMSRFVDGLDNWFKGMGFNMKVEKPVTRLEEIEFCQCRPIWTPEGYVMVRNIRQSLGKDSTSIKPLDSERIFRKWCGEVGDCGISLTGGIPVVSEFYNLLIRTCGGLRSLRLGYDPVFETGMRMMAKGMHRDNLRIHNKTRVSFYYAFGVQPDMQVLWESHYKEMVLRYANAEPFNETSPSFILSKSLPQAFCNS